MGQSTYTSLSTMRSLRLRLVHPRQTPARSAIFSDLPIGALSFVASRTYRCMEEDGRYCWRQPFSRPHGEAQCGGRGDPSMDSPRCSRSIARLGALRLKMVLVPPHKICATSTRDCRAQLAKQSTKNLILGKLVKQSTPCLERSCGPLHLRPSTACAVSFYSCPSTENVANSSFEHRSLSRGTRVPSRHYLRICACANSPDDDVSASFWVVQRTRRLVTATMDRMRRPRVDFGT